MIYLDYAATTPIFPEVVEAMLPYLKSQFANPSALYKIGVENRKAINLARKKVADLLGCKPQELYFTSGGTESNNWAIKGLASRHQAKTIITTPIEHHSIIHPCEYLKNFGYRIHYLHVDEQGFIDLAELERVLDQDTLLVTLGYVNNEVGTIQDVQAIAEICKRHQCLLHLDATQAVGHIPFNLRDLNVDLMTFSAHKFHGPKGVGCLYIREEVAIDPLMHGGRQEYNHRAGTENVANIIGLAKALELSLDRLPQYQTLSELATLCLQQLLQLPDVRFNGPKLGPKRLATILNFSFKGIDGADLLYQLNQAGIYAANGSACNAERIEPSHVLSAIGVPESYLHGSVRLSFGLGTTREAMIQACEVITQLVHKLRND